MFNPSFNKGVVNPIQEQYSAPEYNPYYTRPEAPELDLDSEIRTMYSRIDGIGLGIVIFIMCIGSFAAGYLTGVRMP